MLNEENFIFLKRISKLLLTLAQNNGVSDEGLSR